MKSRTARIAAASMMAIYVACIPAIVLLEAVNQNLSLESILFGSAFGAFMVVGALVVWRHPGNLVGWIFCGIGLLAAAGVFAQEYSEYTYLTRPGSLPGGIFAAWVLGWYWYALLGLILVFPLLVFPTGRLLSHRWRPLAWLAGLSLVVISVLGALDPVIELQDVDYTVTNPIGIEALGDPEESLVGGLLFAVLVVSSAGAVASLIIRFRRSKGDERQQLKWFTYSGALLALLPLSDFIPGEETAVGDLLFALVIALPPVSAGIAILKYRLYDIDLIINRTLVYGVLTALLGAVYGGLVVLLQAALGDGFADRPLAVAATTLAVAALFRPARARIQSVIDRRFNRRKYDAQQTVEVFSARLRDEVDLDELSTDLLAVVRDTVQPSHASLWLRAADP